MVITPDDYYARPALSRTSRLSWFRDASNLEIVNEDNPFHEMEVGNAIALLKTKSQFIVEENKVVNQAIDSFQYEAIIQALESYTKDNKKDLDAHILHGYLLFTKAVFSVDPKEIFSLYKQSQKALKRALKVDEQDWRARMTLATVFKHAPGEMNLTDDAVELLEEIITDQEKLPLKKEYAQAFKDLSYVHEQLGQYEKAVNARSRGAKWFPYDPYFLEGDSTYQANILN